MSNFREYLLLLFIHPMPMPYNPTQLPESCKEYHGPSTDLHKKHGDSSNFMHYVFTQILRYSYAVLDCASMKAHVLHFQTCFDQLPSFWNRGNDAARLFSLPVWLSRYHYCYGMEPHKRKRPCNEPTDPKHTYTLGSKNRIYHFGGFEIRE
ncbi:hypothetical protein T11_14493 [Trichinella zimbabwensis]|uniref:Uncharacterized protein n=1 Tax=Trichinella zimbabwensis TaxID=268475 RepID=A0A0V1H117_9BILA|nr:hypothetical protein T11_14493 [Trichinella zimbabwensis]